MATGWLGAIPPPPGVEPNIFDPPSQHRANIALHTVCLTLATASIAIRLYTRTAITKTNLGYDDYLSVVSWVLSMTFSGLLIKSYEWGIGRHMWDVPGIWVPVAFKYFTIAQYIFQILSCSIKLTFLALFYRIFWAQDGVRNFIILGLVIVLCTNIGLLFATIFACTPIARAWNPMLAGHCIKTTILPWLSGALNLTTDLYIFLLPIRPLWRLNMELARKLRLLAVFALGIFACVASLVRLAETPVLSSSLDASWNISRIAVWAVLEANIGIVCASSSVLPAFFERHWPKAISSTLSQIWYSSFSRNSSKNSKKESTRTMCDRNDTQGTPPKRFSTHDFVELRDVDGNVARTG